MKPFAIHNPIRITLISLLILTFCLTQSVALAIFSFISASFLFSTLILQKAWQLRRPQIEKSNQTKSPVLPATTLAPTPSPTVPQVAPGPTHSLPADNLKPLTQEPAPCDTLKPKIHNQ